MFVSQPRRKSRHIVRKKQKIFCVCVGKELVDGGGHFFFSKVTLILMPLNDD